MSEVIAGNYVLFDQIECMEPVTTAEQIAADCLTLGDAAMRFARVERVPRYDCYSRENDAEHSFMLALVAGEIAAQYYPGFDTGLVYQFSIVHDLVELKTDDVATFILSESELASKEAAEHAALESLANDLPPHTAHTLLRYEAQIEKEARFVRLVDKLLPVIVDILGPGAKVMNEDYNITTAQQLIDNENRLSANLKRKFPDFTLQELHTARDILAVRFERQFALESA